MGDCPLKRYTSDLARINEDSLLWRARLAIFVFLGPPDSESEIKMSPHRFIFENTLRQKEEVTKAKCHEQHKRDCDPEGRMLGHWTSFFSVHSNV